MAEQPTNPNTIEDELTSHNYDGIQEYDNPTPAWWHLIFIGTIIFSVFYLFIFHLSPMTPTMQQSHARATAVALERQFGELRQMELNEEKVAKAYSSEAWIAQGASIFEAKCVLCHDVGGPGKEGLGLNLTDNVYKNVTNVEGILTVLREGIGNAMPSQRAILNETEMALVSAYVVSLRDTNHPDGLPPEGVEIPPFFDGLDLSED